MKWIKSLLICFFFFGYTNVANAQFWKKLKKKIEKKVEQKIEQKIEKETDKAIDSTLLGKKKRKDEGKPSSETPKFTGGLGKLTLYNHGYEYTSNDVSVSVYGKFNKTNLSSSVKTYHEDKVIKPVDAYPEGYALAYSEWGYLNPKGGQIIIHQADSTKVVFSVKGTWNTIDGDKPVTATYVSLNVNEIVDKKSVENNIVSNNNTNSSKKDDDVSESYLNEQREIYSPTVNIPSEFNFNKSVKLEITDNQGNKYPLEYLLGNYPDIYAMSMNSPEMQGQGEVMMVITPKSSTMFMDVAGMKMKKSTSLEQVQSQFNMTGDIPELKNTSLKKTGNTKSILGYTCHEYKAEYNYENNNGSSSFWVSKDFPIQNKNLPMLGMNMKNPYFSGFVLELNSTNNNQNIVLKVVKITDKSVSIKTSDYRKMGF